MTAVAIRRGTPLRYALAERGGLRKRSLPFGYGSVMIFDITIQ